MRNLLFYIKSLAMVLLLCCSTLGLQAQKTIVIGPSAKADHDFSKFDSLLTEVTAGNLSGQLVFAFEPGTYTFTKALTVNTAKFTAKDHLTITSLAQDQSTVTFAYSTSTAILGLITLDNTNHVTFSHLTLHNSSSSNGNTVTLHGPTEDVTFYHCNIKRTSGTGFATGGQMNAIGSTTQAATAAQANDNGNNGTDATIKWLRFIGNTIDNGCRNVITMATTHRMQGLVFNDNTIFDNTAAGIMIYRADSVTCNRNHVMVKDNSTSYWSPGIQLSAITGDSVCGNFISFLNQHATANTWGGTAISVGGASALTSGTGANKRMIIANNVILGYNNTSYASSNVGSCSLLSLSNIVADVFFNSIYNERTSAVPSNANQNRTVYVLNIGGTSDLNLIGNQFIAYDDKNQHVARVDTSTLLRGKIVSEYNNLYFINGGTNYAYDYAQKAYTLTDLQKLFGDNTSVSIDPKFADASQNLELSDYAKFLIVPNPGVSTDYQGLSRGKISTVGAYTAADVDAALVDFAKTDFSVNVNGVNDLYVTLKNNGLDTLTSATILWSDAAGSIQKFPWKGSLAPGATDVVNVGQFKPVAGTFYAVRAWVTDPNNVQDGFHGNDTIYTKQYVCKGVLAGDYTIGKGYDFATLEDALTALQACGINASVRLLMTAGTYGTTTLSGIIPGADSKNTITLMPYKNDVVVFDGGSANAGLILDGIAHWVFQGLTIGNTTDGLRGVDLLGSLEDIEFHGCNIYASATATANTYRCVNLPNTSATTTYPVNVRFIANNIRGGYANFYLYYMGGNNTANIAKTAMVIDSNILADAYYYGVYAYYRAGFESVSHNTITSRRGLASAYYGIYGYYYCLWNHVEGNRIDVNNTSTAYGLDFYYYQQQPTYAKQPASVCNNEIRLTGSSVKYGIYIYTPNGNFDVHHNTIFIEGSSSTTQGLVHNNSSTSYKVNMTHNMVYCNYTGAYPLYIATAANGNANMGVRAYNNLYAPTNVAYIGAAKKTVADLMTASTNNDSNTTNVLPVFNNPKGDLTLSNMMTFVCPTDPNLPAEDINGTPRGKVTLLGAYTAVSADAALLDFAKTSHYATNGAIDLYVTLQNAGLDTLENVTIFWNDGTEQKFPWKGSLAPGATEVVNVGQFKAASDKMYQITAWVSDPNNTKDGYNGNDTIRTSHYSCSNPYAGDYIVGPRGTFATMEEAIARLQDCGIDKPVRLLVMGGTYGTLTISGTIPGADSKNTITLMPFRDDVVIFDGGAANAGLILDGIAHWVFQGLTIGNTKDGLRGVDLLGSLEDIEFHGCNIYASATATASTCRGVNLASTNAATTHPENVRFIANNIQGGYDNFYLYYMCGNSTANIAKTAMVIDSNILSDAYRAGIYASYSGFESVSHNTITNRSVTTTYYGIYGTSYCIWNHVEGNRVHINTTSTSYGIYFTSYQQPATYAKQPAYACNNEIRMTGTGTRYGLEVLTPYGNWEVHHNTIYIQGNSSTTYGFQHSNANNSYKVNFTRNMVYCSYSSAYPLYMTAANAVNARGKREYNNLYAPTNVAYIGAAKTTVADLMTASTNNDSNTTNVLPVFVDITKDLRMSNDTSFRCPTDNLILTDINNVKRDTATAMGAYHLQTAAPAVTDAGLKGFSGLDKVVAETASPVYVVITNEGDVAIDQATIDVYLDGSAMKPITYQPKTPLAKGQTETVKVDDITVKAGEHNIWAVITMKGDANTKNDTAKEVFKVAGGSAVADAALKQFVGLDKVTVGTASPISVVISNEGDVAIDQAIIYLSLNGVVQKPAYTYQPRTPLAKGGLDTVAISNVTLAAGTTVFTAFIEMKNDADHKNDTITDKRDYCAKLHGTFVVGNSKKADYAFDNITDLWNDIQKCGVDGDITLAIESGTYTLKSAWKFNTSDFNGHHLTVTSLDNDRDSVVINYAGSVGAIQFNNTNNVTFSHLTVNSTATSSAHTVCFNGNASNVTFYRCALTKPQTVIGGNSCVIGAGTTTAGDNANLTYKIQKLALIGNLIDGGCRNTLKGTATNRIEGLRIEGNTITNTYDGIMVVSWADDFKFIRNECAPRSGHNQNGSGVSLSCLLGDSIYGNVINSNVSAKTNPSTGCVLYISGQDTNGKACKLLVANNVILGHVGAGWRVGTGEGRVVRLLGNTAGSHIMFCNNSILNNNKSSYPTSAHTAGVKVLHLADSNISVIGNIIAAIDSSNQFPLCVEAAGAGKVQLDYNNYWNNGGGLAYYNGSRVQTLTDMQKVSGGDKYSVSTDPQFADITKGLQLSDYTAFYMPNANGLAGDILNIARGKTTTMGAYHNEPKEFDLAVTAIEHPDSMDVVGQPVRIAVRLTNKGTKTVSSATVYYLFNATATSIKVPSFSWSGTLAPGQSVVAYSSQTVALNQGKNTLTVYIAEKDEDLHNDTLDVVINANNVPLDAALTEFIGLENINPVMPEPLKVVVSNNNVKPIETATVTLYINGIAQKPAFTYQPKTPLAPKASDTLELGKFVCQAGAATFMAVIDAKGDIDAKNDTLVKKVSVEALDLKLDAIVSPQEVTGPVCYGSSQPVIITITNNSKRDADFSAAALKIALSVSGAASMNADTAINKGTLAAGKSMNVQLKNLPTVAEGDYSIAVEFGFAYDSDASNNAMKTVYRVSRIGIPYDVDFSSMPKEIVTYTETGRAAWILGNSASPVPAFGTGCLQFAGEKDASSVANATMNGIDIQGFTAPKLSFWYAHAAISKGDSLIVKATTDGGRSYTVLGRIATLDTANYWKQYDYDLSGFAKESCLSVVFQAVSGGANQYIDRIRVSARQDASIAILPLQVGTRTACSSDPVEVKAVVTNLTVLDLPLANDTITLNVSGAVQTQEILVYNKTLKGFESDTVTVGKFVPNASGSYYLEVAMQPMDDDASNDIARDSSLFLLQDVRLDSVTGIDEQMVKNAGDSVWVTAHVANNGNTVVEKVYLQMKLNGTEVATDTVKAAMGANDTIVHTFRVPYIVPFATKADPTYTLEVSASFDCDGDNANNALTLKGKVNVPDTIDLHMVAVSVTDPAQGKTEINPTLSIGNTGNTDATDVKVHVTVYDNSMAVLATLDDTIANVPMNDTLAYAFTKAYTVPNYTGAYTLVACIEAYANDADNSNDTLSASFACTKDSTGIGNATAIDWTMGQNIPNPASSVTRIPYTLPQDGRVTFSVMNMNGQLL
ncbi:MAG: hypothetical protein J5873_04125, partial [Bacteroidales bacterium]|nr:hypothetical protein [Bacteroidales bacterium]